VKKEKDLQRSTEDLSQPLDSLVIASLLDLANSILSDWRPYLKSEGEMLLGRELSLDRAVINQLQDAVKTRNDTYEKALELVRVQTSELEKLRKSNDQLKRGYNDLCKAYDEIKRLIHEISIRQKNHIQKVDKRLNKRGL